MSDLDTVFTPVIPRLPAMAFGGDWNPEQWSESVWEQDIALMQKAGVNLVTLGVFSWAIIQPDEKTWNFEWLDKILNLCLEGGIKVDMATATASPPPWLGYNYPDTLAVTADGMTLAWGARQHYSPSSKTFIEKSQIVAKKLVERYANHEAIVMWHVGNEFGAHTPQCFSDESAAAFRKWLKNKFGTIEKLNERWGTRFWSQQYSSFDEVMPPRTTAYFPNPSQQLDFKRFSSDAMLALYQAEYRVIRDAVPKDIPVTTNYMRLFPHADYWKWSKELDIVSDDWYPDPSDPDHQIEGSLGADLMRSLKVGKPWLLMEQAPSAINWRQVNAPKTFGSYSRWSIQQMAHGADGILHFQWRASVRGAEKWHSGMVPHAGQDTRVWQEVCELGANLKKLDAVVGARTVSKIAIGLDWNSWWGLELDSRPSTLLRQRTFLLDYYRHFFEMGYSVDFVHPEQDLTGYQLVVFPNLYLASDAAISNIRAAIDSGVNVFMGAFSVAVDDDEGVREGGHLAGLRDLFGSYTEEWHPLYPQDSIDLVDSIGKKVGSATGWAEFSKTQPGAEALLKFSASALEGRSALTKLSLPNATTWILSCSPDRNLMQAVLKQVLLDCDLMPITSQKSNNIEVAMRENPNHEFLFALNHSRDEGFVVLEKNSLDMISSSSIQAGAKVLVPAGGWVILQSDKSV
jgi:beta-galactosidase